MYNFLVIFCAHVDSPEKKKVVLETLNHMKDENIDVCYLSHSNMYLEEISSKVKFCSYDSDNEFLDRSIYLENVDLLQNNIENNMTYCSGEFGTIIDLMPGSPHTKSALKLLKSGTIISHCNFYEWTIYLEYDVPIPKCGFRELIESKINILTNKNKKCFYYKNDEVTAKYLWGCMFIYKTENIYKNDRFLFTDWSCNARNWVKTWGLGFFEAIVESVMKESFTSDEILTENIRESSEKIWNIHQYGNLSRFSYFDSQYSLDHFLKIGIFPNLINDKYEINLFVYYTGSLIDIFISNLLIKNDEMDLFILEKLQLFSGVWNIWRIDYYESKNIYFEYTVIHEDFKKTYKQKIAIENLKIIYEKLNRIEI